MSSWVAPAIAAEMWGVSIEQIMARVADGSLCSVVDGQFLFVDIASAGFAQSSLRPRAPEHTIVTPEELTALSLEADSHDPNAPEIESEGECSDEPGADDDRGLARDVLQWRIAREQTRRLRRPPAAMRIGD